MPINSTVQSQGGWFDLAEGRILGSLRIDGERTELRLHDREHFPLDDACRYISGTLHDLQKVTLIDCHSSGPGQMFAADEKQHFYNVTPRYVLIGNRHLDPTELAVRQVSLLVDDAEALFPDHDAFGTSFEPEKHIDALAADYETAVRRPLRRGSSPRIHFFGGETEIISVETRIGKLSVNHRNSFGFSEHANDFGFKNRTWLELEFAEAVSFDTSITRVTDLLRFIEIMAGRPQNLEHITIYAPVDDQPASLNVHWLFRPSRASYWENRRVSNIDLLINPIVDRAAFESVLRNWVEMDVKRKLPRCRSSQLLGRQRIYDPDRLVAAANMFDLLPDDALPLKPELEADILQAKQHTRKLFKNLPDSEEQQSILIALRRIGNQTLQRKISHRAHIVNERIAPKLQNLALIVSEAVKMRNYYVHGDKRGLDYQKYPGMASFLTEALEFIFTSSDLIDAGWDIQKWYLQLSTLSHPFKQLVERWESEAGILQEAKNAAMKSSV